MSGNLSYHRPAICARLARCVSVAVLLPLGLAAADSRVADAAMNRDFAAIRGLLKQHADVNGPQSDGTTALQWMAHWDDVETAGLLIRAGAKANTVNLYGDTPLLEACTNGNAALIEKLISAGADPNTARPEGQTALMTAARSGNAEAVKVLLQHGAAVDSRESWRGQTALMWAAMENHPEVAQELLAHGAAVDARSTTWDPIPPRPQKYAGAVLHVASGESDPPRGGLTPLLFAARQGSLETVKVLAAAHTNLNLTDPDGTSALVVAIINGHFDVACLLLDLGADPNLADKFGRTALYAAVDMHTLDWSTRPAPTELNNRDSVDVIESVLAHGGNPNARLTRVIPARGTLDTVDRVMGAGATPFLRAAKGDDLRVMRLLIERGADPKLLLPDHSTPLMLAAGQGWRDEMSHGTEADAIEAIKLCQQLGFDVNAQNDAGETALHLAAALRRANQVVQYLVDNGAKLDIKDKRGRTPLDAVAASRGGQGVEGIVARESTVALLRHLMGLPAPATTAP